MFKDATAAEVDTVLQQANKAFAVYRKCTLKQRADFMRAIAAGIEALGDELLKVTGEETSLPEARLRGERARTIFQLTSYADACEKGDWLEARIDTAIPDKAPPKPDLRKMMVPLGPVVIFGAANFPFAYSTAGGDTATALAAGCPVIVKAHPAHPRTSEMVAGAILKAAAECNMPAGVFAHIHGVSFEVGKALVEHPFTKAVGFTGSFAGGKQLFDWANQRKVPIPVFAEMSSTNPVFLLPEKMKTAAADIAVMYAGSITLGMGQFCTKPGLIIGLESKELDTFVKTLGNAIQKIAPATMLHTGIFKNYRKKKDQVLSQAGVDTVAHSDTKPSLNQGSPTIATATGKTFIENPALHQEVFGPFALVIRCKDMKEMLQIATTLEGQLTTTLMATENDLRIHDKLIDAMMNLCGRFILNNVPTGVEVCLSMQHGGPYPSSTDSRFGSVGADGIMRFVRPVTFQNWTNELLPDALKNENLLGIWRMVNGENSRDSIAGSQ
jgi:2,5-dioxopentanoate dehydrogenase